VNRWPQLPLFSTCFASSFLGSSANTLASQANWFSEPPQKSPEKHFRKTLSANFFGLRFKLNSDSVCGNWDKNRPIIEVTALSWVHGMGEELRAGGRSASGDTRRDEPEFGMGRVTGISLPGYCL